MPVQAFSRNRDFRHEVASSNRHTFSRDTTQRDAAYDSILFGNLLSIEEVSKLLCLVISRDSRCQSYTKAGSSRALNTLACSRPRSGTAMQIVKIWCGAVETDL